MERVYVYHWCNFVIQFYIKIRSSKNNLENKRIGILIHQRLDKQDSRFSQIKNYLKNLYTLHQIKWKSHKVSMAEPRD